MGEKEDDWVMLPEDVSGPIKVSTGSLLGGRYRVERRLASGGMASVYVGHDTTTDRKVALKMTMEGQGDDTFAERLRREGKVGLDVSHENIVRVIDTGQSNGMWYLVMELLDGTDLEDFIARRKHCEPHEIFYVLDGVLRALAYAHGRGVVHRDLKPSNVFLVAEPDQTAKVKLIDFGVVMVMGDQSKRLTSAGSVLGTPEFMSPEQALGGVVDERSDLYAVGCVAYAMLCGRPPFTDRNPLKVLTAHATLRPDPPTERRPESAKWPALADFIMRSLAKKPELRFQTADAMRAAMIEVARAQGIDDIARTPLLLPAGWQEASPLGKDRDRTPDTMHAMPQLVLEAPSRPWWRSVSAIVGAFVAVVAGFAFVWWLRR
jgi:serine/threonine protein kinase